MRSEVHRSKNVAIFLPLIVFPAAEILAKSIEKAIRVDDAIRALQKLALSSMISPVRKMSHFAVAESDNHKRKMAESDE